MSGLTLVELLIAMAILVTITGSTMLMFRGITQTWRSGQLRTERYQQARLLFDLFARELSSCVSQARYPFIGNDVETISLKEASTQHEVFFVAAIAGRSGLVERGYWVNGEGTLMCHDDEPADGDYEATGIDEPCGTDVVAFEASYFDGTQWLSAWDGRHGGDQEAHVPKAVRLTLTVGEKKPEQFETIVHVPTS
jgi:type II secretory pathway pseudopilin PulG